MDPQRADSLLQLVFSGEYLDGHDPQAVRIAVASALKLDDKRAAHLFSGKRVVMRRGLSVASAHRHIVRFAMLGAVLRAEPSQPRRPRPAPVPPQVAPAGRVGALRRGLQWTGIGLVSGGGGVLLGLVLGPGLVALWPESSPPAVVVESRSMASAPLPPPTLTAAAAPPGIAAAAVAPAPTPAAADDEIPPDMSAEAVREHQRGYWGAPKHKAFAISSGGAHAWHAGAATQNEAAERALDRCVAARRPSVDGCRIVDVDGNWTE